MPVARPDKMAPSMDRLEGNRSADHIDLCIVGGGMSGIVVARDAASCGYRSVVIERDDDIGGVWLHNNYQGLRLHGLADCYRCFSLAPPWQQRDGSQGRRRPFYRPCRGEIMDYIREMASHPLIMVRTGTVYIRHERRAEGVVDGSRDCAQFEVEVKGRSGESQTGGPEFISCRAVVFATGTNEMATGAPSFPIDPESVTNGTRVIHSSELARSTEILDEVERLFVVGSSKAAIDVLHNLMLSNENENRRGSVVWCHRGHCIFVAREHLEGWATSKWLPLRLFRHWLFCVVYWMLRFQLFRLMEFLAILTRVCARAGVPMTNIPLRGGIESRGVLAAVGARYCPGQKILAREGSVTVTEDGGISLACANGGTVSVGTQDAMCFCTGQTQASDSFYPSLLDSSHNRDGVFTVLVYAQVAAVNALLTALWTVLYLDGEGRDAPPTVYSTKMLASECERMLSLIQMLPNRHPWAVTMSYFGLSMLMLQGLAVPGVVGDLSFDYRWREEWFGADLDLRADLSPLCTRKKWRERKAGTDPDVRIELAPMV